jgi:cbb3-type cytochrome oxidase subunit 3
MSTQTIGWIAAVSTIVSMLAVVAVVAWTMSKRRSAVFDAAARLPLEEDARVSSEPQP